MENVTRFIGSKRWYDRTTNTVHTGAFFNDKNKESGEISVFDIDKELQSYREDKIFEIGDKKVYRKPPHTAARADMKVADINMIRTNKGNLQVIKDFWGSKHCNIRPFPSDASALNIAMQLAKISNLKIRK